MKTETENPRELDVWLAEHVMGWRKVTSLWDYCSDSFITNNDADCLAWNWSDRTWKPTTDPAAAMAVLEKCTDRDCLMMTQVASKFAVAIADDPLAKTKKFYTEAEALPLAICLFAKKLFEK